MLGKRLLRALLSQHRRSHNYVISIGCN